jgi:hypothetical protein
MAEVKAKLSESKKEKHNLHEQIEDQNFTLNGLINIDRRNETYENLKNQLKELEDHLKTSELDRAKQFKVTG